MTCNDIVPVFEKDPVATLDYTWDWTAWLGEDEILTATFTPDPGITVESSTFTPKTAVARVTGGSPATTYQVACTIQTVANRTDKRTAVFLIKQQ